MTTMTTTMHDGNDHHDTRSALYVNITVHDASEAVKKKVHKKLFRSDSRVPLPIRNAAKATATKIAAELATPDAAAKNLEAELCHKMERMLASKGMDAEAAPAFREGPYLVLKLQIRKIDAAQFADPDENVEDSDDDDDSEENDERRRRCECTSKTQRLPPIARRKKKKKQQQQDENDASSLRGKEIVVAPTPAVSDETGIDRGDTVPAPASTATDADTAGDPSRAWKAFVDSFNMGNPMGKFKVLLWSCLFWLVGPKHRRKIEHELLPKAVQSKMHLQLTTMLRRKLARKGMVADALVLQENQQARYFYEQLQFVRSNPSGKKDNNNIIDREKDGKSQSLLRRRGGGPELKAIAKSVSSSKRSRSTLEGDNNDEGSTTRTTCEDEDVYLMTYK